ncbi:hypothetical protein GE300_21765 [Rhodobacteraceae bacterium 2CG4]|uniref:DUF4064 domain-containing protein n=1 Tax=Halovulum marinum TaxID=2662447 RepID=A0A6L5Z830_9RHOB|nr:hypothetical protein [Halovulum marinum]MSU92165.1 hypothetical protein [Halovulum marinum]
MKQAAVILGIIGGILGLIVGISVAGWIAFTGWVESEGAEFAVRPENAETLRVMGVIAPLLAISGGAMAVLRPFMGAVLLLGAAAAMYWAFGVGFFTLFPIAMCGLAGLFALGGAGTREPGTIPKNR